MTFLRNYTLLFVFCCSGFSGAASIQDSLLNFLQNENLSIRERVLNGIDTTDLWLRKDNSHALRVAEQVKEIAFKKRDKVTQVLSLLNYAKALDWNQEYRKAKSIFENANEIAFTYGIDSLQVDALCGIAHTYSMLHDLDKAADNYIKATKLTEEGESQSKKAEVYVLLAEYYRSLSRYDIATNYLDKARVLVGKGVVGKDVEIEMYSRYSAVWNEQNIKMDSAILFSELCIELGEKTNDLHVVATANNELASLKKKTDNSEYVGHILTAMEIWREMNYLVYEGRAIMNFVYYTYNTSDYNNNRNIEIIENFLDRAKEKEFPLLKQDLYHVLSSEYEVNGNTKKALEVLKIYTKLTYDNTSRAGQKALSEAQEKYEADKLKLTIADQEDSLTRTNKEKLIEREMRLVQEAEKRNYLILTLSLLIVLLIVSYLIFKTRKQNQKLKKQEENTKKINIQLEETLNEKELLLKEIHHRVKNNLQIIIGLLELQSNRIDLDPVKKALLESINRVRSMSIVHQKLYQGKDLVSIEVKEYVSSLLREIELSNTEVQSVKKELDIPKLSFDIDSIIPLGLIITELFSNSFKYAFEKESATVCIKIELIEDNIYQLIYKDNGKGLPKDFDIKKSRSLGMRLIQQLARQLNGIVEYKYDQGAMFLIKFEDSESRKKIA